nr:uncharacterized protein LOC117687074 [Crassostrea gigas]
MLREKRQRANESLPELGESIRHLAHLAYPTAPREVTEMIAKDQFIDALTEFDMRLRIQQSPSKSLNEAIRCAVEIEAFCRAERQRRENGGYVRTTSNNQVTPDAQDPTVREELRQLRDEMQATLRYLEKKIVNVSVKESSAAADTGNMAKEDRFPFRCHHCGKKGHMIKDCFLRNNKGGTRMQKPEVKDSTSVKGNTDSNKRNDSRVSSKTAMKVDQDSIESGLFVKAKLNSTQCNLLLDTGGTLTILSDQLYAEIGKISRTSLLPISQRIVGADGAPLTVQGKGIFGIKLGSQEFETQAVIANIKADGIIGLDFLQTNECLVDVCKTKMYARGIEHELEMQGNIGCFRHHISTEGEKPTKQHPRRLPHHAAEFVDKEVQNMVEKGIVEPSSSPWAAGVVLVEKKDGTKRSCVDYRSLNNKTVKDAYPLPRIDDSLDRLEGASWFCTLDLHSGYWQVEMNEADKPKTAFVTRSGLFQFTVMPFGLCNSPATFERLMEVVLAGLNFNV